MAQSSYPQFFTQEELNNLKSTYEVGGLEAVVSLIRNKLKELQNTELHIAVTGESGAGKSSFINTMRGLRRKDKGAAKTGTTETTMKPTPYPHPNMPTVCFWDLPGIGTTNFPAGVYLQEMNLNKYDFFIIISDCRFRENDAKLAKAMKELGKNFYFVRSKIDNDLHALEMEDEEFNTDEELGKIRDDCVGNLAKAGISSAAVFLISNFKLNKYDFPALKETLEDGLDDLKKHVFFLSLQNTTIEIIEKKSVHLMALIWIFAIISGTVGAVPVPGLSFSCDVKILTYAIKYFRNHLGLDDASLQRMADTVGKPVGDLKAVAKSPFMGEINEQTVEGMMVEATSSFYVAFKNVFSCVPIIGLIIGAVSSFHTISNLLKDALNDLTENAKRVVQVAFGSHEKIANMRERAKMGDRVPEIRVLNPYEEQALEISGLTGLECSYWPAPQRDKMAQSSNSTYFNQEELKEIMSTFESGGLGMAASLIKEKVNKLKETELNIAVTGESGMGKSTFINSMRGLRKGDKGAAKIGLTETTMTPTQYPHPSLPNVCFWDLPGVGTTTFPAAEYLREMDFNKYDFFIIISGCRFTENDVKLAKEIKQLGKKFYFVRSKIDNDLHSLEMEGATFNIDEELDKIRNYSVSSLKEAGVPSPTVFLISSYKVNQFDFPALNKTLADNLDYIKKDLFLMSLSNTTLEIVENKKKQLKNRIWMLATISGAVGAVPIPGLSFACDIGILVTAITDFRQYLGLDDASLQRLANMAGKPVEHLKAEVKTPLLGEINAEFVKRMLHGSAVAAISAAEIALDSIPFIGSIFGAGSSFLVTFKLLNDALNDLVENAQIVVRVAFETD
ncbi:uncharacterized protein LOC119951486 [Scyliorhinus canicula]|uniref:uncharacterized protein LOC119951486 n=1 Tax=Scyliorhinus canicula TaxID=7830 RepID=UPI0018F568C4|nr:uncharacterized protein LOC119951486 [Scyliorhinus canicula]